MSKIKILVTMPIHEPILRELRADPGLDFEVHDEPTGGHGIEPLNWPVEWLRGKEILFCSGVAPKNFGGLDSLKFAQLASAGYEQFLGRGLEKRGIRVANARGVFDVPIGEWCIAMIINLLRDIPGMLRNQQQAIWDRDARFQRELRGLTVGFWGYGGLARETARIAKTMGMRVHTLVRNGIQNRGKDFVVAGTGDPEGKLPDRVFTNDQKSEFLRGLDFLVLAMPLTPATDGIVKADDLRQLPRHAYLLNPARGGLVVEDALIRSLREGWIAGAALDAHYHYPMPPDHPLWRMPNVIMTPHISGSGEGTLYRPRAWDIFRENLKRYRAGTPLMNELSAAALRGE